MMIVRLFPKTDLSKVWEYVESDMIKNIESEGITPLYATQTEGMMNVGVIFDANDPDNVADFITENIAQIDEIHHSKTITLMKPLFFPIPKTKPEQLQRFIIRIYTHARHYKDIYNFLRDYDYPYNLFPIYLTYSLGDEDIILNVAADSYETVSNFVKEQIRYLDGSDTALFFQVIKAKRFASLEKLIEHQQKHLAKDIPLEAQDTGFDYVEDFEYHALLTGAFRRDL